MRALDKFLRNTHFISYALVLTAVSAIPSWFVFNLLFSSAYTLPGVDPAQHIVISRLMLSSRSILVPYSQFFLEDANVGYYPSVWQGFIALLRFLTGVNEVDLMRYFMFFIFLLGEFNYWLLTKDLSDGEPIKGAFVYFTLLFSIAPIIKTIRDGIYGEIIAMWFLFPLFLRFFLRNKVLYSVAILIFIIAIHNLSVIMVGLLVLSFLTMYSLLKERKDVIFTIKVMTLTLILSSPLLFYNYLLTFFGVMSESERFHSLNLFGLGFSELSQVLSNLTLYIGILSLVIIFTFYRRYRWLPLWFCTYLIVAVAVTLTQERFVREMSIPLSLSIGIVLYDVAKNAARGVKIKLTQNEQVREYALPKNAKVTLIIFLLISSMIAYNGIIHIASESDPVVTDYFTSLKAEAYEWLNNYTTNKDGTIVVRGLDSWARVYLNHYVYEVWSPAEQKYLSTRDRMVNNELTNSLLNPFDFNAFLTFKKYNVSYFILSAPLPNRWYSYETETFAKILLRINYETTPFYKLIYHRETGSETIKIYKILWPESPRVLSTIPIVKDNSIILRNNAGEETMRIPFWETTLVFNDINGMRLLGHPNIENIFENYTIRSEISYGSIVQTTILFKNSSYEFTYEAVVEPSEKSEILNLTASTNVYNLCTIGVSLSFNSTNYIILTPDGKTLKYDYKTNRNIEAEGFEIIQLDNNVTVIVHTGSLTVYENLFEWNIIRPVLERDQAHLDIIILSDSEAFVADGIVYVRYDNLVKPAQEIIDELLHKK